MNSDQPVSKCAVSVLHPGEWLKTKHPALLRPFAVFFAVNARHANRILLPADARKNQMTITVIAPQKKRIAGNADQYATGRFPMSFRSMRTHSPISSISNGYIFGNTGKHPFSKVRALSAGTGFHRGGFCKDASSSPVAACKASSRAS